MEHATGNGEKDEGQGYRRWGRGEKGLKTREGGQGSGCRGRRKENGRQRIRVSLV